MKGWLKAEGRRRRRAYDVCSRYVAVCLLICVTVCAHKTGTRICRRGCSLFIWADLGGPDVRVSIHYYYKFPNITAIFMSKSTDFDIERE